MNFSIYNKFVEVALNWCASINCYNKTIIEKSYLRLPKDMFIKSCYWLPVDNLPSKIENLRKFSNRYSQEQTEYVNCHYRQMHIQSPIKDLRCSFWRKQSAVAEAYSERSQISKMKLFEKKIFSRPLFQPFTIYTKSSILDVRLRSEYASGTINYFRERLHLDV